LPVPILAVDPHVVIRTPTILILPIAAASQVRTVPSISTVLPVVAAILHVVAAVLPVTLRLRVLPPVLPAGISCRVARALIGSRSRLSRCIARSACALCVRKRHCRCER
jgi:hypothetical protein